MHAVMKSLGIAPNERELMAIMKLIDVDDNDTIDFPEFLSFMAGRMRDQDKETEEELREAFNVFDTNRDGKIDRKELIEVMESLGEEVPLNEIDDMIREGGTFEA